MIKLTPVTSSNLKAIGHKDGVLYVEFKGGKTFSYEGVCSEVYNAFIESDSVGRFFARNIKPTFKASEVKKKLISQDDCAPDSLDSFSKELEALTGYNLELFKSASVFADCGDRLEWCYECFLLTYASDDPFYNVVEI